MDDRHIAKPVTAPERREKRRVFATGILIVVMFYCGQRLWHFSAIKTISHDAAVYLNICRQLGETPEEVMSRYPRLARFAIVIERTAALLGGNIHESRIVAGRLISFIFGLGAAVGIWVLAMQFFGNIPVAVAGTLLFIAGKKFIFLTTDILRGPPALCFGIWGLVAVTAVCKPAGLSRLRAITFPALAGLLAGLGAYFRPEVVLVLPIAIVTWFVMLLWPGGEKRSWRNFVVGCACLTAGFAIMLIPIVLMAQADSGQLASTIGRHVQSLKVRTETLRFVENPVIEFAGKYFGSQHAVGAGLAVAWVVSALWILFFRSRFLSDNVVRISRCGAVLMIVSWLILPVPIFIYYIRTGAMSHRYLMMIAAIMAGAAGAGLFGICNPFRKKFEQTGRPGIARSIFPAALCCLLGGIVFHARPPRTPSVRLQEQQAGKYLSGIVDQDETLLSDNTLTIYFSRIPEARVWKIDARATIDINKGRKTKAEAILSCMDRFRKESFTYCSFNSKVESKEVKRRTIKMMSEAGYKLIKIFNNDKDKEAVMIFMRAAR